MTQRILLLYLEKTDEYLPRGDGFGVNDFVQLIRDLTKSREAIRETYMVALDSKSRGTDTVNTTSPNNRLRSSNTASRPPPQIPTLRANPSINQSSINDNNNQPNERSNAGDRSHTAVVLPNYDGNIDTSRSPVVPSDLGDNLSIDNGSIVNLSTQNFITGHITEDVPDDYEDDKLHADVENVRNTEVRTEDNITGTSVDNAINFFAQVENNEASVNAPPR